MIEIEQADHFVEIRDTSVSPTRKIVFSLKDDTKATEFKDFFSKNADKINWFNLRQRIVSSNPIGLE